MTDDNHGMPRSVAGVIRTACRWMVAQSLKPGLSGVAEAPFSATWSLGSDP